MDEALLSLTQEWLSKAKHDLDNARIVRRDPDGPLDTAIYHCQQAAEKALKGWLTWEAVEFEKTHDLVKLIKQASINAPEFSRFIESAQLLTPYASAFRYPGLADEPVPGREEFDEALRRANELYGFVCGLIKHRTELGGEG